MFGVSLAPNTEGSINNLSNQPCHARPTVVDINSNQPLYYLFTVSVHEKVMIKK